jgi:hypothetical protein
MAVNAAYLSKISNGGTSTATTAEACSLVSGKTYKVTSTTKRVLDPTVARVWKDNLVVVSAANILSENLLFGTVTFVPAYTVTGPITVDANYIPMQAVAFVTKAELSGKVDLVDTTPLNNTAGAHTRTATTVDASMSLEITDALNTDLDSTVATQTFITIFQGRSSAFLVEFNPDGGTVGVFRGWFVLSDLKVSVDPGDVVRGTVNAQLNDQGSAFSSMSIAYGVP